MACATRVARCKLPSARPVVRPSAQSGPVQVTIPKPKPAEPDAGGNSNIVLQPRLCTLRSYGSDRVGVMMKTKKEGMLDGDDVSPFFATLSEYIESSKNSHDFEIISGRLAMMVFAATVTMEMVTGNSVFRKLDIEGLAEAGGVCLGAVTCAALFAWFSSARNRVGGIFTVSCNAFIDYCFTIEQICCLHRQEYLDILLDSSHPRRQVRVQSYYLSCHMQDPDIVYFV